VKSEKRHPADFALWKKADPGHIMRWPSPWGPGFPGWHIECSAMSMKYLGESFDIHGGGLENQFPHHECEIAQSEGATGKPFVKCWMHNNMVTVNGQKMGKSLGNFTTLKDAFRIWKPDVIRFFILQSHYRGTLDFSGEAIDAAGKGYERLLNTVRTIRRAAQSASDGAPAAAVDLAGFRTAFLEAMDDDFNTPQAIAVLFDLSREVNQLIGSGTPVTARTLQEVEKLYAECGDSVLGLSLTASASALPAGSGLDNRLIDLIGEMRQEIRALKLWELSDKIRERLAAVGIALEDRKDGTTWKRLS
jgi:cysteinyl-tRNA synthetase